jgi:hypothetical protein
MVVGFTLPMQSMPITTNVKSLNPAHDEVYSIQHNVIKFVSNLRQVGSFLWVLQLPQLICEQERKDNKYNIVKMQKNI